MVMEVIWHRLCVSMTMGRVTYLFEFGKGATSEAGNYLFMTIIVWLRCAQYFVMSTCG